MKKLFYLLMAAIFLSSLVYAHPDEPSSSSSGEVLWHTIIVIDYKPGTVDEAKAMIQKFENASESCGSPHPDTYWFESGKYDLVVTWKLPDGPADLDGKWSPAGEDWWNALVAQEGSEAAAQELQNRYNDLIAASVTSVARKAK